MKVFPGGGVPDTITGNKTFTGNVVIQGTLDVTGVATFTTTVTGSGNVMAGAAFALGFTGRGQFKSSADGFLEMYATDGSTALTQLGFGTSVVLRAPATDTLRLGRTASATPAAQVFRCGEDSRSGTDTNVGGSSATFQTGLGTGTGTASSFVFQTPTTTGSGTGVQSYATRLTIATAGITAAFQLAVPAGTAGSPGIIVGQAVGSASPEGLFTGSSAGDISMAASGVETMFWKLVSATEKHYGIPGGSGSLWKFGSITESMTLNTGGATTDSSADLLPANSFIESVVARVTTTITTATDWKLGDATTAGRFTAANATLTAGTTDIGSVHMTTGIASATTGQWQAAAAKLRITTTGTPGAGVVRVTVYFRTLVAPTS